jgi:hypothetical protein
MSKQPTLVVRITKNPFHHLWNNNGTWWCHYTEHLPNFTKRRVRRSLHTSDSSIARFLRDSLLCEAAHYEAWDTQRPITHEILSPCTESKKSSTPIGMSPESRRHVLSGKELSVPSGSSRNGSLYADWESPVMEIQSSNVLSNETNRRKGQ